MDLYQHTNFRKHHARHREISGEDRIVFCLLEENVSQVGLALKYVYVDSRKVDTDSGAVEQTDQNQWNFLPIMLLFRTKFLTELQPDVRSGPND